MPSFEEIQEMVISENPDAIFFDGLEDALVGVCRRFGMPSVAMYDYEKCVEIFMADGGSYEEVVEYLEYNTLGTWAGDSTPAFFVRFNEDE